MYLLLKIHKRLYNVPGRPVISNCGTPTEKVSEFLDNHLKPVMREGMSYIKYSNDFMHKIRDLKDIPNNALLVTADVVGLYPSIPNEAGLQATLYNTLYITYIATYGAYSSSIDIIYLYYIYDNQVVSISIVDIHHFFSYLRS